jgi:hypothetical protein
MDCACCVSKGLLQCIWSEPQCQSRNLATHDSLAFLQSSPSRFWQIKLAYWVILCHDWGKPQSADCIRKSTRMASSAAVRFCCSLCASRILLPLLYLLIIVLYELLIPCAFAIAWTPFRGSGFACSAL